MCRIARDRNFRPIYGKSDISDDISMKFDHPEHQIYRIYAESDISVSVITEVYIIAIESVDDFL